MLATLVLAGLGLRAGLRMRRLRRHGQPPKRGLLAAHLRMVRPAVVLILAGGASGPLSAVWLRDWSPFGTLHAWLGLTVAGLFAAAGWLGWRMQRSDLRRDAAANLHGSLGTIAMLVAAVAAVAGMALLP